MSVNPAPVSEQPLDEFANCHGSILQKLDALDTLPALLAPAAEARRIAADSLQFFDSAVLEHHAEEERELFPAVLFSATKGPEHDQLQVMVERLTREHREVESAWNRLKPHLAAIAKGHDTQLDTAALTALVARYKGHARYEEASFLPLCKAILGRNGDHLAALGVALHLRRVMPGVLERYGHRI